MDLTQLPSDLPRPVDDGAARHLIGMALPTLPLQATTGQQVDLACHPARSTVVYVYPLTGRPNEALPLHWDLIPGARGCTAEACGFRDHHQDLATIGADVFGLSTQTTDYQRELVQRVRLPFPLLSDADFTFASALHLPTFEVAGLTLLKRLTLIVQKGRIEHVFYPIFPPDRHAEEVLNWLRARTYG